MNTFLEKLTYDARESHPIRTTQLWTDAAFSCVVVGAHPGKQLHHYDFTRETPPRFTPMDPQELEVWRSMCTAAGFIGPDATIEQLYECLVEHVDGITRESHVIRRGTIGTEDTHNPEGQYITRVEKQDDADGFFVHRDGGRVHSLRFKDWDWEEQKKRRHRQANRRFTEFERLTRYTLRPPKFGNLARHQIELGFTFATALERAKELYMDHPFNEICIRHAWEPDLDEPMRSNSRWGALRDVFKDGSPYEAFCLGYPNPRAEFVRRAVVRAGMPVSFIKDYQWHDWRTYRGGSPRSGDADRDFMPWRNHVAEMYESLDPDTLLTAYYVGPWVW